MNYSSCPLYNIKTYHDLEAILGPGIYHYKKGFQRKNYHVRIDLVGEKERLIEAPCKQLKIMQKKILMELNKLDLPLYYFSKKGSNNVDNALAHIDSPYLYQIDISKFYPCTSRTKVFNFWKYSMKQSAAVAMLMTNITTINYSNEVIPREVSQYCVRNSLELSQHLPTGAPTSSILAFLVNYDIFENLAHLSKQLDIRMSIYVDDISFSSQFLANLNEIKPYIKKIFSSNGYRLSFDKSHLYDSTSPKIITGIVIHPNGAVTPTNKNFRNWRKIRESKSIEENHMHRLEGISNYLNMINLKVKTKSSDIKGSEIP